MVARRQPALTAARRICRKCTVSFVCSLNSGTADAGAARGELHVAAVHAGRSGSLWPPSAPFLSIESRCVQLRRKDVAENLKGAVRVRGEPRVGARPVLVEDAERAKQEYCISGCTTLRS